MLLISATPVCECAIFWRYNSGRLLDDWSSHDPFITAENRLIITMR